MDPLIWVVVVATILSGFFSLVSFALRSFRRVQLEEAFEAEDGGAERLDSFDKHLKDLRLTASWCRSLSNVILVVAIVGLFTDGLTAMQALIAVVIAGALIAVFGVAIPNAWARHAGEGVLAFTYPILLTIRYLFWPVTALMAAFDVPIRRLSGAEEEKEENGDQAKQEILHAVSEGQAEGAVDADELEMIESVMEFSETHAGEIMTPRTDTFALAIKTPWKEAAALIVDAGHSRVPVFENDLDNVVGILYAKDLLQYVSSNQPVEIRDILRQAYFVPETKPLDQLLKEFKARKVHMAVLLDEYGGTAGLVTIEDLLEEIVGDISDEYDEMLPASIHPLDSRSAELDGRVHIDEVNDALDIKLPEDEDYDTAAGLVFSELGYIPTVGETLEAFGVKFTVLEADERKITRLRIEVLEQEKAHEE